MTRSDEDTRGDGQADKWETFRDGLLVTVAFDENGDGRPDRRLTYGPNGALELIEAEPDGAGEYTRRLRPGS